MKRFILFTTVFLLTISAIAKSVTPASSLPTYYKDIDGKSGKSLFDAVHVVAKVGYSSLGYSGLWTAYRTTDVRDNGKIWDMYNYHIGLNPQSNYSRYTYPISYHYHEHQ